ncbi:MAG: histidine--tRNA ligase [Candidatus Nealsonbacteria bacterium CG23_combo_of_CG06-09_8_20_14_all_38_19]|uniref:Histidine--tRNA ligase n=1 Tax=Candidatus Nealsonbacteria bacterium CG23_combo_of_CG06-09_8_20_14_all_38_19 TaxID=1974721 RepID=A0A2G9YW50_9BACT|nr:MAG: histidine--tRNA ligase [Candidatus Nealsonbacteria bacterium CG23_combo_of_CG06-09_8_20_14_all_38_19]
MKEINVQPPSGTRDFLSKDVKKREWALNMIKQVFEVFGFAPIDTPAFERIETLTGKYGEEGEKLMFKILKRGNQAASGETDLALRYDFTVPLVRFFAKYQNQLPRPFRRYQIGPVWRADRPGKGRFREFYQCDIDVIGSSSLVADAEVILALTRSLSCLGLPGYIVRLNSRRVLTGLLEAYGIPETSRQDTLTALDKLDKIGVSGVAEELKSRGLPKLVISQISDDLSQKDMGRIRDRAVISRIGQEGLQEVDEIISLVSLLMADGRIEFSPFMARGLDYYTGPIFEIYLKGATGAIASGGRYDDLVGKFVGGQVPACGGSLGIDRILSTLEVKNPNREDGLKPQVFVTVWDRSMRPEALQIAEELRNERIITEVFLEEGKISNQIRLASNRGAKYCLFYGPDEQTKKEVTIKNLSTGEQRSVSREKIAETLQKLVQER